jgi:hypothetical protein
MPNGKIGDQPLTDILIHDKIPGKTPGTPYLLRS